MLRKLITETRIGQQVVIIYRNITVDERTLSSLHLSYRVLFVCFVSDYIFALFCSRLIWTSEITVGNGRTESSGDDDVQLNSACVHSQ